MDSLLNEVTDPQACNFVKKKTLTQVFFCEYCVTYAVFLRNLRENFRKNTYFEEHLRTSASEREALILY